MKYEPLRDEKLMLRGLLYGVVLGISGGFCSMIIIQMIASANPTMGDWVFLFGISWGVFSFTILFFYNYIKFLDKLDNIFNETLNELKEEIEKGQVQYNEQIEEKTLDEFKRRAIQKINGKKWFFKKGNKRINKK